MNDLDLLHDLHARTAEPSTARLAPGRQRLLTVARAESPPPRGPRYGRIGRPAALAGLAGTLAAALLVTTVMPGEHPVLPRAEAAADVLDRAAEATLSHPDPVPRADQYIYAEVLQRSGPPGGPAHTHRNRSWASADGAHYGLAYEDGHKMGPGTPGARIPERTKGGARVIHPPRYAEYAQLPRDAGRLLAYLRRGVRGMPALDVPTRLITIIAEPVLPPGLRAAAFRALAALPGTTVRENVTDAAGRRGTGLVRTTASEFGRSESIMILDRRTHRYLGVCRTYVEDVGRDGVQRGDNIVDCLALVRAAVVDRPGRLP